MTMTGPLTVNTLSVSGGLLAVGGSVTLANAPTFSNASTLELESATNTVPLASPLVGGTVQIDAGVPLTLGAFTFGNTSTAGNLIVNGGTFTATGTITIQGINNSGNGNGASIVIESGSTANFTNITFPNTDGGLLQIDGGNVTISGTVTVARTAFQGSDPNTTPHFTRGIIINGGTTTMGSLQLGTGGSWATLSMTNGSLAISGAFDIAAPSGGAGGEAVQMSGGTLISTDPNGLQMVGTTANRGIFTITGGTATLEGITLVTSDSVGPPTGTNTINATVNLGGTNGGTLYLDTAGMTAHLGGGAAAAAVLNPNGVLGAIGNWTLGAGIQVSVPGPGSMTIQADNGQFNAMSSRNITIAGNMSGSGPISKTGAGDLILTGNNSSYGGTITVNAGNIQGNTDGLAGVINTTATSQTVTINQGTVVNGGSTSVAIGGPGSVVKTGANTATLSNVSGYTGTTTISQGNLTLQASNAINQTSQVIMAGGTLGTGGTTQDFTTSAMPATLKVTANSTIDLGGSSSLVKFSNSNVLGAAWTNGAILRISGWNGTPLTGSASDPEQLIVGTDTTGLNSTQLSHIHFTGFYTGATFASVGVNPGEVVPNMATILKGDVNQDGSVSVADISALMVALTNISGYESGSLMFQGNFVRTNHATALDAPDTVDVADIDGDGFLTNLDIQAEINLVADPLPPGPGSLPAGGSTPGGVTAVPEPASFVLLALGGLALAARRYRRNRAGGLSSN